jgi:hypothetical protein
LLTIEPKRKKLFHWRTWFRVNWNDDYLKVADHERPNNDTDSHDNVEQFSCYRNSNDKVLQAAVDQIRGIDELALCEAVGDLYHTIRRDDLEIFGALEAGEEVPIEPGP